MRVFLTGATGFVGSAIIPELINAGHQVTGLARSDAAVASLTAAGAEAHRGSLEDLESLRSGAAAADGVIHCGFIHDFSDFAGACATDLRAIEALGSALVGSGRPFINTSGIAILDVDHLGTEEDAANSPMPRTPAEPATLALAGRGVRASVMRLPPSVHGDGDRGGFVPMLIKLAREKGVSAYVGDGSNRWPAVHRLDAARLYRLALEQATAGTRLHAVGDEGVPTREIAGVIGRRLNLPVVSVSAEEAGGHFDLMAHFVALNCPASSALTRERFGWQPTEPDLLTDLEQGTYFAG